MLNEPPITLIRKYHPTDQYQWLYLQLFIDLIGGETQFRFARKSAISTRSAIPFFTFSKWETIRDNARLTQQIESVITHYERIYNRTPIP